MNDYELLDEIENILYCSRSRDCDGVEFYKLPEYASWSVYETRYVYDGVDAQPAVAAIRQFNVIVQVWDGEVKVYYPGYNPHKSNERRIDNER